MIPRIQLDLIRWTVTELGKIEPDNRMLALQNLADNNNGRCDLPSPVPGVYDPALPSLQVFGVFAMSDEVAELPKNWLKAARNIIEAADDDAEVAA